MSCPVVPYHTPSIVNRFGQLILQSVANPGMEGKFTIICRLTIIAKHLSVRTCSHLGLCMFIYHTSGSNVRNGCGLVLWTMCMCSQIEDMDVITSSSDADRTKICLSIDSESS